uniref:Deoxyribonuclease n=1 Tax=Otarine gammaherpesvirus 4 TaxID=2801541 RepID=A0A889IY94_9GAMA|nr:deoxyribonuclease [Otarine gammaherpesvirus 4]
MTTLHHGAARAEHITVLGIQPLLAELDGLDVHEQLDVIRSFTFSGFLRTPDVERFMATCYEVPQMPALRFVYLYFLCKRIEDYIGDARYSLCFEELMQQRRKRHRHSVAPLSVSCCGNPSNTCDDGIAVKKLGVDLPLSCSDKNLYSNEGLVENEYTDATTVSNGMDNETCALYIMPNSDGNACNTRTRIADVYRACRELSMDEKTHLCLIVEAMTRGQRDNVLWNVLRDGTISSSKFPRVLKRLNTAKNIFNPWPITNDYYVASPVAFGLRSEFTAKLVLSELVYPHKSPVPELGFMLSPADGIFGVSLDMCFNATISNNGTVQFPANCEVYEIKSRFKYLFAKSEFDPLHVPYQALYENPGSDTLATFIRAVPRPAVEVVHDGCIPTETEYLITTDTAWGHRTVRKRRLNAKHRETAIAIRLNARTQSVVYILDDPVHTGGKIGIKAKFPINVFANPRHAYFYQILLQYKIVKNYIQHAASAATVASTTASHTGTSTLTVTGGDVGAQNGSLSELNGPGCFPVEPTLSALGSLRAFVVSAFFRKRHSSDPIKCTIGSRQLSTELEIPVAIIVTPVIVPHAVVVDSVCKAADFWKSCAQEEFVYAPWAGSHLFAAGDITP